jgi:hypothetical protein
MMAGSLAVFGPMDGMNMAFTTSHAEDDERLSSDTVTDYYELLNASNVAG